MTTRPPERPCTSCGYLCRSKNQICMPCNTGHTRRPTEREPLALEGGTWQPVRGILRWVPDPKVGLDELAELRQRMQPPPPTPVACPKCGALVTETCRTKNGHRTSDHGARQSPRICACGADLKPKCRMCETCALIAAAEQRARWNERAKEERAA